MPQRVAEALKKRNAQGNNQKNIPPPRTATIQQQRTQTSQRNQPVEKQTKKTKNSPRKQPSHHETRKHKVTHAKRNTINQKKQARKHESRSTCHRAADAKRSTNATMQETRCTKISSTQSLATKHGAYATPAPREIHPPTTHPHIHPHTHRHLNHQPPPTPRTRFCAE